MRTLTYQMYYTSRQTKFRLWPFSCTHLGNKNCDEELLQSHIQEIKCSPRDYWLHLGDSCEYFTRRNLYYRESIVAPWLHGKDYIIREETKYWRNLFRPIFSRCLGIVEGTHEVIAENKHEQKVHKDIIDYVLEDAEKDVDLGIIGFVVLIFRQGTPERFSHSWVFRIICHHGVGVARTPNARDKKLHDLLWQHDADMALQGHIHYPWPRVFLKMTHNGEYKKMYGLISPSYLRNYTMNSSGYGEYKNYPPTFYGAKPIIFTPFYRRVELPRWEGEE
jgi:predicted phosphodiesterase